MIWLSLQNKLLDLIKWLFFWKLTFGIIQHSIFKVNGIWESAYY